MNFLEISFQKKIAKHYHRQKPDNQAQSIYTSIFMYYLLLFFCREYLCSSRFFLWISFDTALTKNMKAFSTNKSWWVQPSRTDWHLQMQSTVEGNCSSSTADPQINWVKNVTEGEYYDFKMLIPQTFKWLVKQGDFKAPKAREVHKVKHWFEEHQKSS